MPHYHVSDFDRPERFAPAQRAQVLAEARDRIREIETDRDGRIGVSEALDALTDETST